jgi:hypothetical protein
MCQLDAWQMLYEQRYDLCKVINKEICSWQKVHYAMKKRSFMGAFGINTSQYINPQEGAPYTIFHTYGASIK